MARTSNKPGQILEFVNLFIQENGYSPSVREIGEAVGMKLSCGFVIGEWDMEDSLSQLPHD